MYSIEYCSGLCDDGEAPVMGLGRAQAESERPPAGLPANSLWTGSIGSHAATAARIPPTTYQLRSGSPSRSAADRPGRAAGPGVVSTSGGGLTVTAPRAH